MPGIQAASEHVQMCLMQATCRLCGPGSGSDSYCHSRGFVRAASTAGLAQWRGLGMSPSSPRREPRDRAALRKSEVLGAAGGSPTPGKGSNTTSAGPRNVAEKGVPSSGPHLTRLYRAGVSECFDREAI